MSVNIIVTQSACLKGASQRAGIRIAAYIRVELWPGGRGGGDWVRYTRSNCKTRDGRITCSVISANLSNGSEGLQCVILRYVAIIYMEDQSLMMAAAGLAVMAGKRHRAAE